MKIISVKYLSNYILKILFNNGMIKKSNLKSFLFSAINPMTTKYRNLHLFKKVKVENGYLTWGNGEMDLSAENILTL